MDQPTQSSTEDADATQALHESLETPLKIILPNGQVSHIKCPS